MSTRTRILVLSLAALLVVAATTAAELLPPQGTFQGYYHRDHQGVGHFAHFYVDPELHSKLARYEDKLIRLEVKKLDQMINPGPGFIREIGKIEELPQPPLRFNIRTRPSPVIAGQPFQLLVEIQDTRPPEKNGNPDAFAPEQMHISFQQPRTTGLGPDADKPSPWYGNCYTPRQVSVDSFGGQFSIDGKPFQGPTNLFAKCGDLELRPGDSWVWVVSLPASAARTDGDVFMSAQYLIVGEPYGNGHERSVTQIAAWQDIPVRPAESAKAPAPILRLSEVKLTPADPNGWCLAQFTVAPVPGLKVRVPGAADDLTKAASIGRIEAFAADGTPVELEAQRTDMAQLKVPGMMEWPSTSGTFRTHMVELPPAGAVIKAQFRKRSRFAPDITRVTVGFVTDLGLDTLTVTDTFRDADVPPETPFGPQLDGMKLRIRPARAAFKPGEPLQFFVQAVNVSGKPVCWWSRGGTYGGANTVEIDGQKVSFPRSGSETLGGWTSQQACKTPYEWTVALPRAFALAAGQHTVRYTVTSPAGAYKNGNCEMIPFLEGTVESNEAGFRVE